MNPDLTTLDRLLAFHDWTYEYSDDYSAWCRGRDQRNAINAEQHRLARDCLATQEEIDALVNKYRPKGI